MINRRSFLSVPLGLAGLGALGAASLTGCDGDNDPDNQGGGRAIDTVRLDVAEAMAGLQSGRFTAEGLLTACLAQAERWEGAYNAFTWRNPQALAQARAIDQRRLRGEPLGALAGVPVVIKESMDYQGAPSTLGWHRLSTATGGVHLFPSQHAVVVQRLLAADAVVVGKTNIPAFSDDGTRANSSWAGPTYNAVERSLVPGASSSGVATAVAAGFALLGVGEETGGSIQNPSAAQSLVGLTPTYGLLPTSGVVPLAGSTRDVVGPIARCVFDAAIAMDLLAGAAAPAGGYQAALGGATLQGKRLGLYGPGWRSAPLSTETQTLYLAAQRALQARGAVLVADPFAGSGLAELALPNGAYDFRGTESAAHDLHRYLQGLGVPSLAELKRLAGASPFDAGEPLHWYAEALPVLQASLADPSIPPDLSEFHALRAQYRQGFQQVMDAHGLDALVLPQTTEALPDLFGGGVISETTVSALNIAGLPGLTVPAGQHASNKAPFSLIFVGRAFSEASLLALGHDFEQATRQRVMPRLKAA
ncbi:amidase, partial [Aquabacterium sp.]|uniref:amidase n=1 Tax=Aquabacterium sp. TaxID=1872578 RepID=UPI002BABDD38